MDPLTLRLAMEIARGLDHGNLYPLFNLPVYFLLCFRVFAHCSASCSTIYRDPPRSPPMISQTTCFRRVDIVFVHTVSYLLSNNRRAVRLIRRISFVKFSSFCLYALHVLDSLSLSYLSCSKSPLHVVDFLWYHILSLWIPAMHTFYTALSPCTMHIYVDVAVRQPCDVL